MSRTRHQAFVVWTIASMTLLSSCSVGGGTVGPAPASSPIVVPTRKPAPSAEPIAGPAIGATASTVHVQQPGFPAPVATVTSPPRPPSPLASLIPDLESASYNPSEHTAAVVAPAALSVPAIGVDNALITSVGVYLDGRFEVPEATMVGWYRFGPAPSADGVTVLAAHLNFDGVDGVFRRLNNVDVDDQVTVTLADGSTHTYRVTERRLIDKNELPPDEIWARTGPSRLVLITCGGRYDASRRSYEDNVVVFAEPL